MLTCQNVVYFQTLSIAFCIAIARFVIDKDSMSCLVILEYVLKISKVKTTQLGPTEFLLALKDI